MLLKENPKIFVLKPKGNTPLLDKMLTKAKKKNTNLKIFSELNLSNDNENSLNFSKPKLSRLKFKAIISIFSTEVI